MHVIYSLIEFRKIFNFRRIILSIFLDYFKLIPDDIKFNHLISFLKTFPKFFVKLFILLFFCFWRWLSLWFWILRPCLLIFLYFFTLFSSTYCLFLCDYCLYFFGSGWIISFFYLYSYFRNYCSFGQNIRLIIFANLNNFMLLATPQNSSPILDFIIFYNHLPKLLFRAIQINAIFFYI